MAGSILIMAVCALLFIYVLYISIRYPAKAKSSRRIRLLIGMLALGVFLVVGIRQFGPRGKNPLFSQAGVGTGTGADDRQTWENGNKGELIRQNFDVTVKGDKIELDGKTYHWTKERTDGFEEYLQTHFAKESTAYVKDDFAVSGAWYYVINTLKRCGMLVQTTGQ